MAGVLALILHLMLQPAAERTGPLQGTIVGRDTAGNQLTVAHADVPGVMMAMTMAYEVRGQRVAALPKNGTHITATLHESNGAFWLTDVQAGGHEMPMASDILMRQTSGTAMKPAAAPMHMSMTQSGDWMLMLHGQAFVSQVVQT